MKKPIVYSICSFVSKPFTFLFFRPKVYGKEIINNNDGFIFAGTHTSYLDAFLIAFLTHKDLYYIVKKELHKGPFGWIFKYGGTIPVDRGNKNNKNSMEEAEKRLKEGNIIVIFPEGTINKNKDELLPFKYGAVSLAAKTGARIVPFAIRGKFRLFKGHLSINIGKPYKVTDDLDKENKKLEKKVLNLLKEKK